MTDYTALDIPAVPTPTLPENPTDAQWAAYCERMRLLLQREELLSAHYERWHLQQYRDAAAARHAEWVAMTAASTAAQAARAAAERAVADAGAANAAALRYAAQEMRDPPPVVVFPS